MTAVFDPDPDRKLLPIEGLSGDISSFDEPMLSSLRWAATHYVAPLSVILRRTVPPNVPRSTAASGTSNQDDRRQPLPPTKSVYNIGSAPYGPAIADAIEDISQTDRNVVIIAPSVLEIGEIADHLTDLHGDRVEQATSSMSGAAVTRSWIRIATNDRTILIGTREVMFWPFGPVGLVIVVEDGRRVMRSPGTPTLSVRDVILERSRFEGFSIAFFGPVPTLETIAKGTSIVASAQRQWPMIEVVDRGEDPPGGAMLTERAKAAIKASVAAEGPVFVLVGSRGYAPAFRCVKCGEIRRCATCSSAASREETCRRCGARLGTCESCGGGRFQALGAGIGRLIDDIAGIVGRDAVGRAQDERLVIVGTERDLIGAHGMGLSVAVDVDGFTMAPHYRAAEDGLRLLVRLAQSVRKGAGNRCLVQTAEPNQPVVEALVRGRSEEFLAIELESRGRYSFPPEGSLIAIETDGSHDTSTLLTNHVSDRATIMGPAQVGDRMRWLIQGRDLDPARLALRPVINTLRSKGAKVRVDVDPIDL